MTRTNTAPDAHRRFFGGPLGLAAALIGSALFILSSARPGRGQEPAASGDGPLLRFLGISASAESVDYVFTKTQFQLHTLLTEQRHPKTWGLSDKIARDTQAGLRMLLSVDEDIVAALEVLAVRPQLADSLVAAVEAALSEKRKIFIYGCGATGRLAKQMESVFWRPFWRKVKSDPEIWNKLKTRLDPAVDEALVGEMTGGDRALISSLEGFEDLPLIGRLQLQDHWVQKGDLVIGVTEGGETSSVIGAIQGAFDIWKTGSGGDAQASRRRLFFVYNNPDDTLRPFDRSRKVLEEPGITKINLTTGPQAIAGSTRMQAATIETFVLGSVLETGVERVLRKALSKREMERLGFKAELPLAARLRKFAAVLDALKTQIPALAKLTDLEIAAYARGRFSTYFARDGLMTVFVDSTERSPTFRLLPLDTTAEPRRKCWIQVWTEASDWNSAWRAFLGRPFRGLNADLYRKPFEEQVEDHYLREKALASLTRAGKDQAVLYDFSFADPNITRRGPKPGDIGIEALIGGEIAALSDPGTSFFRFARLVLGNNAGLGLILVPSAPGSDWSKLGALSSLKIDPKTQSLVAVAPVVDASDDPFGIRAQIALKMLLNAHSTAVMAKLGKVVGNTMTNVSPSNLKLVGRATYLILTHVNDRLNSPEWARAFGRRKPVSYGEANAVLFDAIAFLQEKPQDAGLAAEVPLSIIRILESLRQKRALTNDEALAIYRKTGLAKFLAEAAVPPPSAE